MNFRFVALFIAIYHIEKPSQIGLGLFYKEPFYFV